MDSLGAILLWLFVIPAFAQEMLRARRDARRGNRSAPDDRGDGKNGIAADPVIQLRPRVDADQQEAA
jgi:hypothetical protein